MAKSDAEVLNDRNRTEQRERQSVVMQPVCQYTDRLLQRSRVKHGRGPARTKKLAMFTCRLQYRVMSGNIIRTLAMLGKKSNEVKSV